MHHPALRLRASQDLHHEYQRSGMPSEALAKEGRFPCTILLRACALRRIWTMNISEAGCPPKPWRRRAASRALRVPSAE